MSKPEPQILMPAILDGLTPLKDGGMSLRFHTQEATNSDKVAIMELHQQFGFLLFKPNKIQISDMPKESAEKNSSGRSASQRIRDALYVLYKEKGSPYGVSGFERFYQQKMEELRGSILRDIDQLKRGG